MIKATIGDTLYKKYQKFQLNNKVNTNPLCRWCPNPQCSQVITLKSAKDQKGKCTNCDTEICPKCNQVYHNKTSCDGVIPLFLTYSLFIFIIKELRKRYKKMGKG